MLRKWREETAMKTSITLLASLFLASAHATATEMAAMPSASGVASSASMAPKAEKTPEVHVVSNRHINRIVTPFKNPSLKMDMVQGTASQTKGNVLYFSTNGEDRVAAFITEKGDESKSISVVFIPKPVPPQEIMLGDSASFGAEVARNFERAYPRNTTISSVLNDLAMGNLPSGYTEQNLNALYFPDCRQEGLSFDFYRGQFFSGGDYVVTIGVMKNTSQEIVQFKENHCYREGVAGVSSWPNHVLAPNQSSEVLVMFYRQKPVMKQTSRKSLLAE